MPRYHLPNGKSIFTEKALSPDELDELSNPSADVTKPVTQSTSMMGRAKKSIDDFIIGHIDELAQKKSGVLNPNPNENPLINKSFLPDYGEATNPLSKAVKFGYENLIQPLASPFGMYGAAMGSNPPKEPIGTGGFKTVPKEPPINLGKINPLAKPPVVKPQLPIPAEPPPGPRFLSGREGMADITAGNYKMDTGPQVPYPGQQGAGTILPHEVGGTVNLSPQDAANLGTQFGGKPRPYEAELAARLIPDSPAGKPNTLGDTRNLIIEREMKKQREPTFSGTGRTKLAETGVADPFDTSSKPVANTVKMSRVADKPKPEVTATFKGYQPGTPDGKIAPQPIYDITSGPAKGSTVSVSGLQRYGVTAIPETPPYSPDLVPKAPAPRAAITTPLRPIPSDTPVRQAVEQWAYGQQGARARGNLVAQDFKDLTNPDLLDKFESGDRSNGLDKVSKYFDERLAQAQKMGILAEDQKRLNYLRHYFEQDPEDVTAAVKTFISKNPQFSKTGKFPTYAVAKEAGITPKYSTIPEIIGKYEEEFNKAVRNKELYDYLKETDQIKINKDATPKTISSPNSWIFKGENAKELQRLISNVVGQSPEGLHKVANAVSWTKNLALGSGVPGTPLNMHMYNITRSNMMARGFKAGLSDFFNGTFKPSTDIASIKANRGLIGDLVDHGMGWEDIEDHSALAKDVTSGKGMSVLKKGMDMQQKLFEDPLFKLHLPATKLRFAAERLAELTKGGLSRDAALSKVAIEANDFYGGINKTLRNKTYSDLSRIGVLAPDWLESRANLTGKGIASAFGKSDPIYGKAMLRGGVMRAAGMLGTYGTTGTLMNQSNRSSNSTSIPLGTTSTGKNREFPILGSAAEGIRLPEEIGMGIATGNTPDALERAATSRISLPAKSMVNTLLNRDDFGNPLHGKDKYGRPIPTLTGATNVAKQVAAPVIPPWLIAAYQLLSGQDPEASVMTGIEAPVKYNTEPKNRPARTGMPTIRMPR